MTRTKFIRNTNVWAIGEPEEVSRITEERYNNIVEASPFFENLGATEKITKAYTRKGYKTVQIVSTNPEKTIKVIRIFNFDLGE